MKPIAWIRPCESEGAVLEWDKPHPSDCAEPSPLYHGSDVDARIAELSAERDRYKAALEEIGGDRCSGYWDASDMEHNMRDIASNALREVG